MLKRLIVAALAIGIVAVGDVPTVEAQQSSKQHSLANGATLSQLRDAIARMTDLQSEFGVHNRGASRAKGEERPCARKSRRVPYRISEAWRLVCEDARHHGIPQGSRRIVHASSDLKPVQLSTLAARSDWARVISPQRPALSGARRGQRNLGYDRAMPAASKDLKWME